MIQPAWKRGGLFSQRKDTDAGWLQCFQDLVLGKTVELDLCWQQHWNVLWLTLNCDLWTLLFRSADMVGLLDTLLVRWQWWL